jgi:hypothetical protein
MRRSNATVYFVVLKFFVQTALARPFMIFRGGDSGGDDGEVINDFFGTMHDGVVVVVVPPPLMAVVSLFGGPVVQ